MADALLAGWPSGWPTANICQGRGHIVLGSQSRDGSWPPREAASYTFGDERSPRSGTRTGSFPPRLGMKVVIGSHFSQDQVEDQVSP
jgi:hypothetical protein